MGDLAPLLAYLLSSMGLTVLVVWPRDGPGAFVRERWLRPMLPARARGVLDCYICASFWCGLLSPAWWLAEHRGWCWACCLMAPALFWLALGNPAE